MKIRTLSLISYGLKYRLKISFYLLIVIPFLIIIYIISLAQHFNFNILILISIWMLLGISGFLLIHDFLKKFLDLNKQTQQIISTKDYQKSEISKPDEINQLSEAINSLQTKIKEDAQQLNAYSQRITEYNLKLQRQRLILFSLLQMASLISSGKDLKEIISFALKKIQEILDSPFAYLILKDKDTDTLYLRFIGSKERCEFLDKKINLKIFEKNIREGSPFLIDSQTQIPKDLFSLFYGSFGVNNVLLIPMFYRKRFSGFIGVGNNYPDFIYKNEDKETLELFSKNIAIIVETNLMSYQIQDLEIRDPLTGLYNDRFIRQRLQEEIKRCKLYQYPCSFVLLRTNNFKELCERYGMRRGEDILVRSASIIRQSIGEMDYAGRFEDFVFALLLVEKNKRQSMELAQQICKRIESNLNHPGCLSAISVSAAVTENPLDGAEADELINKAREILRSSFG